MLAGLLNKKESSGGSATPSPAPSPDPKKDKDKEASKPSSPTDKKDAPEDKKEEDKGGAAAAGEDKKEEEQKKQTVEKDPPKPAKKGDYSIRVHIVEARDLKGRDASGMSDPVVTCETLGTKKTSSIKKATSNCTWDEVL
jgi:hypothetical protein